MQGPACPSCGAPNPPGSRFCLRCGGRYDWGPPPAPLGPRYTALRFQIDPLWPPPRRDVRFTMIVLGIALTLVGILLLSVSAIVSGAVAAGQAGCTTSCSAVDPGAWLGWLGLPLLAFGLVLFLVGLWWGLRR